MSSHRPWLQILFSLRSSDPLSCHLAALLTSSAFHKHISHRVKESMKTPPSVTTSGCLDQCDICAKCDEETSRLAPLIDDSAVFSSKFVALSQSISDVTHGVTHVVTRTLAKHLPSQSDFISAALEALVCSGDVDDFTDSVTRILLQALSDDREPNEGFKETLENLLGASSGEEGERRRRLSTVAVTRSVLNQMGMFYLRFQEHFIHSPTPFVVPNICPPMCFDSLKTPHSTAFSYFNLPLLPTSLASSDYYLLCHCPARSLPMPKSFKHFLTFGHRPNCLCSILVLIHHVLPCLPLPYVCSTLWTSSFPPLRFRDDERCHVRSEGSLMSRVVIALNLVDDVSMELVQLIGVAVIRFFTETISPKANDHQSPQEVTKNIVAELEIFGIDRSLQVSVCPLVFVYDHWNDRLCFLQGFGTVLMKEVVRLVTQVVFRELFVEFSHYYNFSIKPMCSLHGQVMPVSSHDRETNSNIFFMICFTQTTEPFHSFKKINFSNQK
jgi:hypothetical protein